MGRPRDPFVAKHTVEVQDDKGANVRQCNYCQRTIKGSATRVRNHFSGLGNDISVCKSLYNEVREEAIQKTRKKRQREEIPTPVVVASDSMITPASQVAPSLTNIVAKPQQVSSLDVVVIDINQLAEGTTGMSNCGVNNVNIATDTVVASDSITFATPQLVSSSVNQLAEGRPGMSNCAVNNVNTATDTVVASDSISLATPQLVASSVNQLAEGRPGMSNCGGNSVNTATDTVVASDFITLATPQLVSSSVNQLAEGRPGMSNYGGNNVNTATDSVALATSQLQQASGFSFTMEDLNSEGNPGLSNSRLGEDWKGYFDDDYFVTLGDDFFLRENTMVDHLPSSANRHLTTTSAPCKEYVAERRDSNVNNSLAVGMASETLQVQPSSSNIYPISSTQLVTEDGFTNAFTKFLMCFNSSSDVTKDPHVRNFLETVHIRGDFQLSMEKSLINIKQELQEHMRMVKESWKTTGCTLMLFNLNKNENEEKFSTLGKDIYVFCFYSPKGIICMESPDMDIDAAGFKDALTRHSPSLDTTDAIHWILHYRCRTHGLGDSLLCEFSTDELSIKLMTKVLSSKPYGGEQEGCLRHEIQNLCIRICWRSAWALSLFDKALKMHECLCRSRTLKSWYNKILMNKGARLKEFAYNNNSDPSRLSIFLSIMQLEDDLKKGLSYHVHYKKSPEIILPELEEILNDFEFWNGGRDLQRILDRTLRIPKVMDTLVPTAGYLALAIDEVEEAIAKDYFPKTMPDHTSRFWKELEFELRGTIKRSREAASYLNPVYFLQLDLEKQPELPNKVKEALENFVCSEQEREKLNEELQRYRDVFSSLPPQIRLKGYHPVKLWEIYGNELPILQRLAIKFLSQPLNCMCNQVKKHMYHLQGVDDYILRLNVRMMEEFKLLGDDFYKPLKLECVDDW